MPTIIPLPGSVDDAHVLDVVDADTKVRYLPRLQNWKRGGLSGKKIVLMGDSTTSNATDMTDRMAATFNAGTGGYLDGLQASQLVNQGNNGASALAFLSGSGTFHLSDAITAAANLYVVCYGINDVRLGLCDEDTLVARLTSIVTQLRAAVPTADILLRIPNSLLTADVSSHHYVTASDGTVNPAGAAQSYTDLMWRAYKRLENKWPNVAVFDAQTLVFGRTCQATSAYMTDQLHPNTAGYRALADALAVFIGYQDPFNPGAAIVARALDSASPWTYYYRIVEDPAYWDLVAYGEYVGQGSGFLDFAWPGTMAAQICINDVVQMGVGALPFRIAQGATIAASAANTRISGLGSGNPTQTMTGGLVKVYRPKYGDANLELYLKQTISYPYRRIGQVNAAGNGFIDLKAHPAENKLAKDWSAVVATDTLLVTGQSPLTLTGFTFAASGNNLRCSKAGTDYSAYATGNLRCAVVGNHAYE